MFTKESVKLLHQHSLQMLWEIHLQNICAVLLSHATCSYCFRMHLHSILLRVSGATMVFTACSSTRLSTSMCLIDSGVVTLLNAKKTLQIQTTVLWNGSKYLMMNNSMQLSVIMIKYTADTQAYGKSRKGQSSQAFKTEH